MDLKRRGWFFNHQLPISSGYQEVDRFYGKRESAICKMAWDGFSLAEIRCKVGNQRN